MDAFESVVCEILWRDGYWVQSSLKVELTKEDKKAINKPSSPRWVIDVVAYSGQRNELLVVECKSYLDSPGVRYRAFDGSSPGKGERYKLFSDDTLRDVVVSRLCQQLISSGLIDKEPSVKIALVCAKISSEKDRKKLKTHFAEKGWLLWDDVWLKEKLLGMSKGGYENSPVAVVAKLLLRG